MNQSSVPRHDHQPLGKTGLEVPRIVFGTTCLGNLFVAMQDSDKKELVRQWMNHVSAPVAIDSAGKYGAGLALEVLGRDLRELGVEPSEVVINNKLGWRRVPLKAQEPTFEPGVWIDLKHDAVQDISYEGILRCYHEGNAMLGDYSTQLVSVHDPDEYLAAAEGKSERDDRLADILGAYQALGELRDAGHVAGVGVGAKDWTIIRELDQHCRLDWVMMANSFTVMNHPPELIEFLDTLRSRDIGLINSAVTHGGFLTGGDFYDYRPIDASDPEDAAKIRWRERFAAICQKHDQSPYQVAVAFGRSHPAVVSVALSTSRANRVGEMVAAVEHEVPQSVWAELRSEGLVDKRYSHLS